MTTDSHVTMRTIVALIFAAFLATVVSKCDIARYEIRMLNEAACCLEHGKR